MSSHILIRISRKPLEAVAVLLFTAVIALVLCSLHKGNEDAKVQYEQIYATIDVRCTVTNLTGDQSDDLMLGLPEVGLFTGTYEYGEDELMEFVEDVQLKKSVKFDWNGTEYTLTALTSTEIESSLWPENGCAIFWNEGYDSSVFGGEELVCLIPEAMAEIIDMLELPTEFLSLFLPADFALFGTDYEGEIPIIGTYSSENETTIYLPWEAYQMICVNHSRSQGADALYATLRDNSELERFREAALKYFVEPDPDYAARVDVDGFYFALDINDSKLQQADLTLRNSMRVNEMVTMLVFILSALAGFLIGFLVIRSRKREITLMRTMGCSNGRIYLEFALEQLICLVIGVLVGGGYTMWNPIDKLAIFAVVAFAGLSAALIVFLKMNLLSTMKEEE